MGIKRQMRKNLNIDNLALILAMTPKSSIFGQILNNENEYDSDTELNQNVVLDDSIKLQLLSINVQELNSFYEEISNTYRRITNSDPLPRHINLKNIKTDINNLIRKNKMPPELINVINNKIHAEDEIITFDFCELISGNPKLSSSMFILSTLKFYEQDGSTSISIFFNLSGYLGEEDKLFATCHIFFMNSESDEEVKSPAILLSNDDGYASTLSEIMNVIFGKYPLEKVFSESNNELEGNFDVENPGDFLDLSDK